MRSGDFRGGTASNCRTTKTDANCFSWIPWGTVVWLQACFSFMTLGTETMTPWVPCSTGTRHFIRDTVHHDCSRHQPFPTRTMASLKLQLTIFNVTRQRQRRPNSIVIERTRPPIVTKVHDGQRHRIELLIVSTTFLFKTVMRYIIWYNIRTTYIILGCIIKREILEISISSVGFGWKIFRSKFCHLSECVQNGFFLFSAQIYSTFLE